MHNKLFVVDNQMAIVGGRNIGNPYFGLSKKYNFRDLDVLVSGEVIPEVARAFDEFWNSDLAFPGKQLSRRASAERLPKILARFEKRLQQDKKVLDDTPFPQELKDWSEEFSALPSSMHIGDASLIQDVPVPHYGGQRRLLDTLDYLAAPSHEELLIVTPYLIPAGGLMEDLNRLSNEGVVVRILTGSMASNNHTIAHSHYKKYRRAILRSGATLGEFKGQPSAEMRAISDVPPVTSKFISLHTKTLVGDRQRCFIGSLNLDPRALVINTENGLLIDSPSLAEELADHIDELSKPENTWKVAMDNEGKLSWTSDEGTVTRQPARGCGQRVADFFFRLLPIESQL